LVRAIVETNRLTDHVGPAPERSTPQRLADECNRRAVGRIVLGAERPALHGADAEHREHVVRDPKAGNLDRIDG
jgi:hypothetical protein